MNTKQSKQSKDLQKNLKLYSLKDLIPVLGVTNRTLLNYIYSGELKAFKMGKAWRVSEQDLQEFIDSRKKTTTKK